MFVSKKHLLVEWGHCDPAGIVFYPNYLAWFDDCTTALFTECRTCRCAPCFRRMRVWAFRWWMCTCGFWCLRHLAMNCWRNPTVTEFRRSSFVIRHQFFQGRRAGGGRIRNARVGWHGSGKSRAHEVAPAAAGSDRAALEGTPGAAKEG